jgi:hypothetical protein
MYIDPNSQGPFEDEKGTYYLVERINRRNGIQYGTKLVKAYLKEPKQKKEKGR